MDRTTARGFVALKIEDPDQTRFTAAAYNNALAMAEAQFALDAKAIIRSVPVAMVAEVAESALPADLLMCVMVRHDGLKLIPTSKYALSFQNAVDWTQLPSGIPTEFYIDDEAETIGLVVKPNATAAAKVLQMDYVASPAVVAADATLLLSARNLLQQYTPAVVARAAYEMLTYVPATQAVMMKRDMLIKEYQLYTNECIQIYNNMVDAPIRISGGRDWQDGSNPRGGSNAFSNPS